VGTEEEVDFDRSQKKRCEKDNLSAWPCERKIAWERGREETHFQAQLE